MLKILFVEDLPSDVELAVLELRKEKLQFEHTTVCTRAGLIKALKKFKPDLIISDYMMPAYNGLKALRDVKDFDESIPFILYTGSINEETAVECLKAGAEDYVIKEHLTRLPFAVKEALEQISIRKEKRASDLLLKENEEKLQSIFSATPAGIGLVINRTYIEVNDTFCRMTGYSRKELIGKSSAMLYPTEEEFEIAGVEKYGQLAKKGIGSVETRLKCKDGRILNIISTSAPLDPEDLSKGVTFTILDNTARKNIEDALRKSQQLFETLAQTSPVGIFRTDTNGYTTYMNPRWLEISGLTSQEAKGFRWFKAVHPYDREKLEGGWNSAVQSLKTSVAEYRILRFDGSIVWVMGNAVPELIDNKIVGYIGTITDITVLKLAEDKLRSSEERLKILFDYAPDAYYLNDIKGNLVDGNIACEKLMGYDKNELIGKNLLKLNMLSLKQLPEAATLLVKGAFGQPTGPDEFELNRKDGSKVTVEIITHPVKIKDQTLVLGIARDISERKRTEKVILESEEKYRLIFENVQDVYYELSIDETIIEISPSIGILSKGQYKRDDLIGKSMYEFFSDPKEQETLLIVLKENGFVLDFEITLKNRDGSKVPCSVSSKVIFDAGGNPVKIIGSMHDVTDRKSASDALRLGKEKAEASDKLKTAFLNNISHEVRTPLNGILGFAEIMSQPYLSEEEKKYSFSMLFESSDRLLNTITNYMDISLITSGSMSVRKKDFIPGQVLSGIFSNYKKICSGRHLELFLNIPEQSDHTIVNSDPEIFKKIVSHLLNNAIKFTERGSINYGYIIRNEELEFFVKDTGIGIGKESINVIFAHFVKEDRAPSRLIEGSGLGLSIAKGMADIIGANLRVESELRVGSSFYFTIPLLKETEQAPSGASRREYAKVLGGALILVAEDDETNFYFLKALLTRETGVTVLHASNGREAVELFKRNPDIVLILMDIKMPEVDGLEATRQIKLINRNVPVIAITAYAMSGDEERVLAAGCDGYLSKPISKKSLLEKIAEFI